MQGICRSPKYAFRGGMLLLVLFLTGCTTWLPDPEPAATEPVVVAQPPEPVADPAPDPEPEPVVEVPSAPAPKPIAIVLSSGQPAYSDIAAELAAHYADHAVYDLSNESLPPTAILRSINDSDSTAVVAIGLRAAQSAVADSNVPVVFSQVFNFQDHDLITERSRGVAALAPMAAQLAAWKQVDPDISRIGLIVGEGHEAMLDNARDAAERYDVELDIRIAHSDQETLYLFRRMVADIDGFWLVPDSRVLSSRVLAEVATEARRHNITLVVPNDSMLQIGAVMSISTVASDIAASISSVLQRIQAGEIDQVPPITELSEVRVTLADE